MKKYFLTLCVIFYACASGGSITTMHAFYDVPVGASKEEVISHLGKPMATYTCDDGSTEYEYIERIKAGSRNITERKYYIIIKDGKVVSKGLKRSSPPAYRFNSYEMQTTQNSEEAGSD